MKLLCLLLSVKIQTQQAFSVRQRCFGFINGQAVSILIPNCRRPLDRRISGAHDDMVICTPQHKLRQYADPKARLDHRHDRIIVMDCILNIRLYPPGAESLQRLTVMPSSIKMYGSSAIFSNGILSGAAK